MPCTKLQKYYRRDPAFFGGKGGFTKDPRKALGVFPFNAITVGCGHCISCRIAASREQALRCMHEKRTSGDSVFVTLSYDDEHLPDDWCLDYYHFQLFMHRLRKAVPGAGRFFMCGEYGEEFGRPHYHAILFNCDFDDKKFYKRVDGVDYFISPKLAKIWGKGFCLVGDVTIRSAGYVARYNMKKISGPMAGEHYQFETPAGEIVDRPPEFAKMSLRPGIGYEWFQRYFSDAFPADYLVHEGRKFPVPRYYLTLYERMNAPAAAQVREFRRRQVGIRPWEDEENSDRRLMVKDELSELLATAKRDLLL